MFEHPSFQRVRGPDVNGRYWFRIAPARAKEGALFVVSRLTGTASLIMPDDSSDSERYVVAESVSGGFRYMEAGHGWSGDWQSIDADALVALIAALVPHTLEDASFSPTTPQPRMHTGQCEVHAEQPALDACSACGKELCAACFEGGSQQDNRCRKCREFVDAGNRIVRWAKLGLVLVVVALLVWRW